jgi:hypothetical protein
MAAKLALLIGVGGTVRVTVAEGTPVSGSTVSVFDEQGNATTIAGAAATQSGAELSIAVSDAICDTEGENYRARFVYTVDGEPCVRDVLFDVVRAILTAPCDDEHFYAQFPMLRGRLPKGETSPAGFLARAWETILTRVRAAGMNPNRIIDPGAFTQAQALLAAARLAENLSVGPATQEWPATAAMWLQQFHEELESVLASVSWYDKASDLKPTRAETNVRRRVVAMR